MLAGDKSARGFSKTMKVACREMAPEDTAVATVSYSENALQLPMDALERYEAFAAMRDQDGASVDGVARAFGITERQVKEALRLGNIHADIRAAYRAGEITLETLKAFDAHPDPLPSSGTGSPGNKAFFRFHGGAVGLGGQVGQRNVVPVVHRTDPGPVECRNEKRRPFRRRFIRLLIFTEN